MPVVTRTVGVAGLGLRLLQRQGHGRPGRWLVLVDGREVGLLENWKGRAQPWHAYAGIGRDARHVGSFYPDGTTFNDVAVPSVWGGKNAAIDAVLKAVAA